MQLFWHRRDARTRDDAGLAAAAAGDAPVVPVFVFDEELLGAMGGRKRTLLLGNVRELKRRYRELGSDLVVRTGPPEVVLPALAERFDADRLVFNEHYRPERRERERRVRDAFAGTGVGVDARTDVVLVDPGRLEPSYPNHGRFHDDWTSIPVPDPFPEPGPDALADRSDPEPVPKPGAGVTEGDDADLPKPGYDAARERFDRFLAEGIGTYADTRDDLARAVEAPTLAVSRMSPYLATGAIGIRAMWADASAAHAAATDDDGRRNAEKYRYELTWREQAYHLLSHAPDLGEANYKSFPNPIAWRSDDAGFEAWARGETGYPLVDAGMRQLNAEGYVHNRPRQVAASFLTKHLLVDWRRGARRFADRLVDHDHAANAAGWQWVASTGTDSVAVRIFDPVSQAAKYDPEATFIREYVAELRGVPAEKVIDWPTLPAAERDALAPGYPDPIVDRDAGYERARRVFETALGKREGD